MFKVLNFVKFRPVGSELFRAIGRMNRIKKLLVASHNFAKSPTKLTLLI